ncbi:NAD(P)-binding protein [Coniochaeta sp. PMI_546]|nr:NAD(P)-binding protein [Coniochaeta sp. PMI_546]
MSSDHAKPVVLIIGSGPNIGAALAKKFSKAGYNVATVSRSCAGGSQDGVDFHTEADLADSNTISDVFDRVQRRLKTFPTVIVWNVAQRTPSPDKNNIFSVPIGDVEKDLAVAVTSPWAAAREAVEKWEEGKKRVFIYTGNIMAKTVFPHPDFTTLGTAKRAASYLVEAADAQYKARGWRFYFADERTPEGRPMGHTPGAESHAEMYLRLAEGKEDLPSYVTFADGKYKQF